MGRNVIGGVVFATVPIQGSDIAPTSIANNISVNSMQYMISRGTSFGLPIGGTPVAAEYWVYTGNNSGVLTGFHASVTTPGSAASVTLDLKKNGTSVLSITINLTNTSTARTNYSGTISTPSYSAGDEFTIALSVSSSTGMAGVKAWMNAYEVSNPQ